MILKIAPVLRLRALTVGLLSFALFTAPLVAGKSYIEAEKVDGIALLPPPPAPDSGEQKADLAAIRSVIQARTPEELAVAERNESLSIFNFAPAIGEGFQRNKYPKLERLLDTVKTNVSEIINAPKNHWQRPRPYVSDPSFLHGAPERSFSYPSGHSTRGTMQALILAEVFPAQRDAILQFGRQLGWDRVILGKHFLTDINAGRVLGQAIFRELMKNATFRRDLAAAKAEVRAEQK